MGTRSTYRIIEQFTDEKTNKVINQEICLMYRQFDGYPSGHPSETAEWLASGEVVNGFSSNETKLIFNGAGCLAAQLVAKYKVKRKSFVVHLLTSYYITQKRPPCNEIS